MLGVRAGGNLPPRPAACELALKGYHAGWARAGLAQLKAASNKIGRGPSVRNEFNRLKQNLTETFGALNKSNQIFIVAVCAILVLYIFLWLVDKLFIYLLAKSYVSEIADVFNLNTHLAAAASFVIFITFVYLLSLSFSFSRSRRIIGVLGLAAMVITHSLLLWQGTQISSLTGSERP